MLDDPSSRFLRWGFGDQRGRVLVTSFHEDPATAPGDVWAVWSAGGLAKRGAWPLPAENNNYFCVSLCQGDRRRQEALWEGLYVLAFDDVGKKVEEKVLLERVGPPGWVIETSPGNFQWFYKLTEPCRDIELAKRAVSLVSNDARDLVRLMRLPVGTNTKVGVDFKTRIIEEAGL